MMPKQHGLSMDTTWLADLKALSETLNFSRAAQNRNITQPAFGRRIRALEAWCGAEIVDRASYRLSLTPAGVMMLAAADDVLQRLDRARDDIEQAQTATATLTFAATHALSFTFFPAWIKGLGTGAATQPMRLLSDNMIRCERMMRAGEAQFLLCHHHVDSPTGLPDAGFNHVVLARDRLVPVTGRDGAGRPLHRLPGTPARPVPQIAFEPSSGMGRILAATLPSLNGPLHLSPLFSSHLAMAVKALAIEGKGVGWIPESLARDELGPGGRLAEGGDGWHVDVDIVLFRPRTPLGAQAERFWQQVRGAEDARAAADPPSAP